MILNWNLFKSSVVYSVLKDFKMFFIMVGGDSNAESQQMYHTEKSTYGLGSFDKSSYNKAYSLY